MKIYAAGSMWRVPQYGRKPRERMKKLFEPLGWEVVIPEQVEKVAAKELGVHPSEIELDSPSLTQAEKVKLWRKIVGLDLKTIFYDVDIVVAYYTRESAGTCSEITFARAMGVPVHIVSAVPLKDINPWVRYTPNSIHSTWSGLRDHLVKKYSSRVKHNCFRCKINKFFRNLARRIGRWFIVRGRYAP